MEDAMENASYGAVIRNLRKKYNLTQQQLAEMLAISQAPISRWENGEREVSIAILERISEVFNIPVADLLNMKEDGEDHAVSPVNIIVVEDVPVELNGTVSMLKETIRSKRGELNVTGFDSVEDALSYCRKNPLTIAFLDVELKGDMDGMELAAELKRMHPSSVIIILTAYKEYASKAWELHSDRIINGYILKPLTKRRLTGEIACLDDIIEV